MIKRLFAVLLTVAAFSGVLSGRTAAASSLSQEIIDGIISRESDGDTEKWLSGLSEKAGSGSAEWYAIALSQYRPEFDLSGYADALEKYLSENEVKSASSRQRCALALIACGRRDAEFVKKTANDSIGEQGIMSLIFGLHLLNNGVTSEKFTVSSLAAELISSRMTDGGWAVMGQYSDVDVTAMAIQALAPLYTNDNEVTAAVDSALKLLAGKQLDNGGFSGYGAENPESAAQVIVALSSLGRDITKESAFIKNGRTVVDAMADFRLPDGGFSHTQDGKFNAIATVQAFYSCVSKLLADSGKKLFVFDERHQEPAITGSESVTQPGTVPSQSSSEATQEPVSRVKLNLILSGACIAIGGIVCIIMAVKGSRKRKDFVIVILVSLALAGVCYFIDIKTPDGFYAESGTQTQAGYVTFSVSCKTALGKDGSDNLPPDGILIAESQVSFPEGGTVYDVLISAAKKSRLPVASSGSLQTLYISGIGGISEFDFGPQSGWVYLVNGIMPSVSCAEYRLSDGDVVEWKYTCALGEDIG